MPLHHPLLHLCYVVSEAQHQLLSLSPSTVCTAHSNCLHCLMKERGLSEHISSLRGAGFRTAPQVLGVQITTLLCLRSQKSPIMQRRPAKCGYYLMSYANANGICRSWEGDGAHILMRGYWRRKQGHISSRIYGRNLSQIVLFGRASCQGFQLD